MPGHTIFPSITPSDDDDDASELTPGERARELADANYQTAVATIRAGDADSFLTELAEIDDRETVQDAINSRPTPNDDVDDAAGEDADAEEA